MNDAKVKAAQAMSVSERKAEEMRQSQIMADAEKARSSAEHSAAAWEAAKLAHCVTVGPAKLAEAIRAAYAIDGLSAAIRARASTE